MTNHPPYRFPPPNPPTPYHCPVCGGLQSEPYLTKDGFDLVRCTTCAVIHVHPMPSPEALAAHYQDPAYFEGDFSQGYVNYEDVHKALAPHFRRRLRQLDERFPERGRLLDFGCADGYFLELAQVNGWRIAGVELSEDMARLASARLGVGVAGSLDDLAGETFEVITMWEVVEHLPDPVATLGQLFGHLKPGGVLMLSTPNSAHWQAVRKPDAWISYRPPSHLFYFTAPTLEAVLAAAGFAQIEVRRFAPSPPLPAWLNRLSAPLAHAVTTGQARPWVVALAAWRAVRVVGLVTQPVLHPADDVYTALEAVGVRG